MAMHDIPEQIAARLTKAQRRALAAMEDDLRWQRRPHGARWAMRFSLLMDTDNDWWRLTPLGAAVRAVVAKEDGDG